LGRTSTGNRAGGRDGRPRAGGSHPEFAPQCTADSRHFVASLLDRDARFEASDTHEPLPPAQRDWLEILAVRYAVIGTHRRWASTLYPLKSACVTPTIVNGRPFRRNRRPDDVRRALELGLPETMADDGDGGGPIEAFVVWDEGPAACHPHAEHVEEIRGDVGPRYLHRVVAQPEAESRQSADVICRETVEDGLPAR
jgi:hypothetical protein